MLCCPQYIFIFFLSLRKMLQCRPATLLGSRKSTGEQCHESDPNAEKASVIGCDL